MTIADNSGMKIYITFPGTSISEKIVSVDGCYDFITGDVNNDGLKDIILSYQASGAGSEELVKVRIYYQTSLLSFGSAKDIDILNNFDAGFDMATPTPDTDRILMIIGDFNNDNLNDIAFILTHLYKYNYLYVAYQKEDNTFENPTIYNIPSTSVPSFFGIASGDFNGDNKKDIVITDYTNSKVYIFYQNSTLSKIDYIYPEENESINTLTPEIKFKGYDNDDDTLKYKLELYKNDTLVQCYNQLDTTNGWNKSEYSSGDEVAFQIPESDKLEEGKSYTLKIYGYDGMEWSDAREITFNTGIINTGTETKNLIFTPNDDGNNDVIFFNAAGESEIKIYDSKGILIYSNRGEVEWNGKDSSNKLLPSGIYFYQIKYNDKISTGTITLIR